MTTFSIFNSSLASSILPQPKLDHIVTFTVEVPYCTPLNTQIMLRSNRLEANSYRHDPLTRLGPNRYQGTYKIQIPLDQFRYKYSHGVCDTNRCLGIEKDINYQGSSAEIPARTISAKTASVEDLVYIWRDTLQIVNQSGSMEEFRDKNSLVSFCHPFLTINDTQGNITIGYDSYYGGKVSLSYGTNISDMVTLTKNGSYRNHFKLSGLSPSTTYYYSLKENDVLVAQNSFRTPPTAENSKFSFGFMGDAQFYSNEDRLRHKMIVEQFEKFDPNLLISAGDLVASQYKNDVFEWPEMGRWNSFFGVMAPLMAHVPFMTAMGNHEEDSDYFWSIFDYPTPDSPKIDHYSFKYGNTLFAFLYTGKTLDYDLNGILNAQTAWLEKTLKEASQDSSILWKIVILHRGPFNQGSLHPTDGELFSENETSLRPSWRSLWEKYGVNIVLAGHNHNFTLARNNNIYYITLCGGAPIHSLRTPWSPTTIYAEAACAAGLFEINGSSLTFKAQRPDGSYIDQANLQLELD